MMNRGQPIQDGSWHRLLPFMAVVFPVYIVIGPALPVLPLHVHERLGLNKFFVGLVSGSQFAAAMFSRVFAGRYVDNRGGRRAVVVGLLIAASSGVVYLLSIALIAKPRRSVLVLLM